MLAWEPIYARRENALHRRRQPQLRERVCHLNRTVAHQRTLVEQRLYHLLDKERVALGALDHHAFEWIEFVAVAQQRREHLLRAFLAQRIQPQLRVVALVTPFMAVLGSL